MINPYEQYRQNAVMLSSPEKLVLMVYDGLIRFIKSAKLAIQEKDIEAANANIFKAQDIITELAGSLDPDIALSDPLASLYDYIFRRLVEANINKDRGILEEMEGLAVELRDTWQEAISAQRT